MTLRQSRQQRWNGSEGILPSSKKGPQILLVFISFELVGSREKTGVTGGIEIDIPTEVLPIPTDNTKPLPPAPPRMPESLLEIVDDIFKLPDFTVDADPSDIPEDVPYYIPEPVEETPVNDVFFIVVEVMPEYPGGYEACLKFLSDNLVYPDFARRTGLEGKVYIKFVVEPDGRLTNFEVERSVAPVLDEEALRVVKLMPKWIPGKQRSKAVRVQFQIPITFKLN
jgi:protein TonB